MGLPRTEIGSPDAAWPNPPPRRVPTERETGLEPATPSLEGWRSTRLSYSRLDLEKRTEIPCASGTSYHPIPGRPSHRTRKRPAPPRRSRPCLSTWSGEWRIRTSVGICRQIYSLLPLAARATLRTAGHVAARAGERIRTPDPLITNQLLYQLSYASGNVPRGHYGSSGGTRQARQDWRCRATSNATAANAALALSEATFPRVGSATRWSHCSATRRLSPSPSAPTTSAIAER